MNSGETQRWTSKPKLTSPGSPRKPEDGLTTTTTTTGL